MHIFGAAFILAAIPSEAAVTRQAKGDKPAKKKKSTSLQEIIEDALEADHFRTLRGFAPAVGHSAAQSGSTYDSFHSGGSVSYGSLGTVRGTSIHSGSTLTLSGTTYSGTVEVSGIGSLAYGEGRYPNYSTGTAPLAVHPGQSVLFTSEGFAGSHSLNIVSASNLLMFSNSSAASWSGNLAITGWTGEDFAVFGNDSLSATQLARIQFTDYSGLTILSAESLPNPIPEPSTTALGTVAVLALLRRRRA